MECASHFAFRFQNGRQWHTHTQVNRSRTIWMARKCIDNALYRRYMSCIRHSISHWIFVGFLNCIFVWCTFVARTLRSFVVNTIIFQYFYSVSSYARCYDHFFVSLRVLFLFKLNYVNWIRTLYVLVEYVRLSNTNYTALCECVYLLEQWTALYWYSHHILQNCLSAQAKGHRTLHFGSFLTCTC